MSAEAEQEQKKSAEAEQEQKKPDEGEQEQKKVKFTQQQEQQTITPRSTAEHDEEEGRRSRVSRSSRTSSAGTQDDANDTNQNALKNKTASDQSSEHRKSNGSTGDIPDGLGNDIEIVNYARQSETKDHVRKPSDAQSDRSDSEKVSKTLDNQDGTNENGKNNNEEKQSGHEDAPGGTTSSSYSLNSRRKADVDGDTRKDNTDVNTPTDVKLETAEDRHAHYMTDDDKQGYSSSEEEKPPKSPRTTYQTMSWEDDPLQMPSSKESKQKDGDRTTSSNGRKVSTGSENNVSHVDDDKSLSEKGSNKKTASPELKRSPKGAGSRPSTAGSSKSQEKPHLVTTYKKPVTPPATQAPQAQKKTTKQQQTQKTRTPQQSQPQRKPAQTGPATSTSMHANRRHISQSAGYPSRGNMTTRDSTSARSTTSRMSRPRTTLGFSTDRRRKEREFFHAELQRLKDSLRKESKKIKKPKVRDHYPDVFTSLAPYYDTYTANYLINMPDLGYKGGSPDGAAESQKPKSKIDDEKEADLEYTSRKTAIGLCDPWISLEWDRKVLPKLETAENRRRRIEQMHMKQKPKSSPREQRPEAKQGSTRLPKFPVIHPPNAEITTKELTYVDVPMLRDEKIKTFSHYGDGRKKSDYLRTRQDFYRMELDRLGDYHENSRPHMRRAYFAYLQNTPGSRQAIYDCVKETTGKKQAETPEPQAVA